MTGTIQLAALKLYHNLEFKDGGGYMNVNVVELYSVRLMHPQSTLTHP